MKAINAILATFIVVICFVVAADYMGRKASQAPMQPETTTTPAPQSSALERRVQRIERERAAESRDEWHRRAVKARESRERSERETNPFWETDHK